MVELGAVVAKNRARDDGQIDGLVALQSALAGGKCEQGFDEGLLLAIRSEQYLAGGSPHLRGGRIAERDLQQGSFSREGGAELVGGVGDEMPLRFKRRLQAFQQP